MSISILDDHGVLGDWLESHPEDADDFRAWEESWSNYGPPRIVVDREQFGDGLLYMLCAFPADENECRAIVMTAGIRDTRTAHIVSIDESSPEMWARLRDRDHFTRPHL